MKFRLAWPTLLCTGLASGLALSQGPAVQLPTYSFFSAGTTVSVPDRGSAYLGGVRRARSGINEFGTPLLPFRNRALGFDRSASSARVSVYVHDFEAMDEYLLSRPTPLNPHGLQPRAARVAGRQPETVLPKSALGFVPKLASGGWGGAKRPHRSLISGGSLTLDPSHPSSKRVLGQSLVLRPAASVAELHARRLREAATRAEEAVDFFRRGRNAEAAGKANVARIYYQMASRRATGRLKSEILARLDLVGTSGDASTLAQTGR